MTTNVDQNMITSLEIVDKSELISIHILNVQSEFSLRRIFEETIFLKFGQICQIVLSSFFPSKEGSRTSHAYIYFKPTNMDFVEKLNLIKEPFPFVTFEGEEPWFVELNTVTNHFRTDPYEQKRILIQAIGSNKTPEDVNFLFREHGEMEQVDFVWCQSYEYPLPTKAQAYLYFREWGEELFTYKLLEELNDVGVFTVKYDYQNDKELLWVYELCPKDENSTDFLFEFGKYRKWIPEDEEKYGKRTDKYNKLNWYFTKAGKFAYAEKIVEDELMKHGGLFIGPDKTFYEVQVTRKPGDYTWNYSSSNEPTVDLDENELDLQDAQRMVMSAFQRCLEKKRRNAKRKEENEKKEENITMQSDEK